MDFLGTCEELSVRCHLDWRPRDENVEADQLTNLDFGSFGAGNRINIEWKDLSFPMVSLLMGFTETFSKRKAQMDDGAGRPPTKFAKSTWG